MVLHGGCGENTNIASLYRLSCKTLKGVDAEAMLLEATKVPYEVLQ